MWVDDGHERRSMKLLGGAEWSIVRVHVGQDHKAGEKIMIRKRTDQELHYIQQLNGGINTTRPTKDAESFSNGQSLLISIP